MKKILVLASAATLIISVASAQKLSSSKVPLPVKTAFEKEYPGQIAKWEKEDEGYEAGFTQNSKSISVVYTAAGKMMETETNIKTAELPASALSYVKKNQPGKSITEAAKITTAAGVVTYEAQVTGKDLIFDKDGNFIKESKE